MKKDWNMKNREMNGEKMSILKWMEWKKKYKWIIDNKGDGL
jgi:hypothetical protein